MFSVLSTTDIIWDFNRHSMLLFSLILIHFSFNSDRFHRQSLVRQVWSKTHFFLYDASEPDTFVVLKFLIGRIHIPEVNFKNHYAPKKRASLLFEFDTTDLDPCCVTFIFYVWTKNLRLFISLILKTIKISEFT